MALDTLILLKQRLMETIAWCQIQPFIANGCTSKDFRYVWTLEQKHAEDVGFSIQVITSILRTPALETHDLYNELDTFAERYAAVEELVHTRASLLLQRGQYPTSMQGRNLLAGGRLVFTDVNNCNSRSNAVGNSAGFFDYYDCPPWDTWLIYMKNDDESLRHVRSAAWRSFLISWIPPSLMDLAKAGIDNTLTGNVAWAEDLEHIPFTQKLRAAGLLG